MRILLFFLLVQWHLFAQNHSIGLNFGTGVSYSIPDDTYADVRESSPYVWQSGINYSIRLKDRWIITTGLNVNQRGFRESFILTDQFGNVVDNSHYEEYEQKYLSIPLLFGRRLGKGKTRYDGSIQVGASGGYLLNASYFRPEITIQSFVLEENSKNETSELFKWDLCAVLESNLSYALGTENKWSIVGTIGGRYSFVRQYFSNHLGIYGELGIRYCW